MKRSRLRKKSKTPEAKLRDECDSLLTPIMKKLQPYCENCGTSTQVAHHWIEKSRSSNLRYNIENLVALCNACHTKIHNRFGNNVLGSVDIAEKIISQRGKEWKERMDTQGRLIIKTNISWYQENLNRLNNILNN